MKSRLWNALCLLLCVTACSTTTTRPLPPPSLAALLQPDGIEGKYPSIELLKADPASTPTDLYQFGHEAEAALRRANRDQSDALGLLLKDKPAAVCKSWMKLLRKCGG